MRAVEPSMRVLLHRPDTGHNQDKATECEESKGVAGVAALPAGAAQGWRHCTAHVDECTRRWNALQSLGV